jgi:hypothetical protein
MITLNKQQIFNYVVNNPDYFDFSPHEVKGRLNVDDILSIKDIQKKFIKEVYSPLNTSEIESLTPETEKAESELYSILHKIGITISKPIKWVVIKSNNGYNWNTCYTQGSVIILSQKAIDKNANIARTLAHEMIHIYQRKHPDLFRSFYKKKMNFDDFIPTDKQLEDFDKLGINEMYVQNPDNCEMGLMVFNKKYLPISVIMKNEKQPVNIVLELNEDGVVWNEKSHQMNSYDKIRLDQPNEMFAYMVTKNIK